MIKLLKRLFKIKRYFFISYSFNTVSGSSCNGSCFFVTRDGYYLNKKEMLSYTKMRVNDIDVDTVVVNNIVEMSKSDYYNWNA